ncbi:hypothetical protein [Lacticaseibacillus saniviri]
MKTIFKTLGLTALFTVIAIGLTACRSNAQSSENTGYDSSISKGLNAVAEDEMDRAVTYFTNALDQKPKDKKATAYLKQAQSYVNTDKQLADGNPEKAVKTVAQGMKVKHGAKSLDAKLSQLQKTTKADWAEYQQLDKAISAQLKAEAPAAAVVKKVQTIVWSEKPYLKRLKPNAEKLLQKAKNQRDQAAAFASSQSNATSTRKQASASSASQKDDAAIHATAEQLRQGIVDSMGPDSGYTMAGLEQVPDKVIVDKSHEGEAIGADIGWLGVELAKQYPQIKSNATSTEGKTLTSELTAQLFNQYVLQLENPALGDVMSDSDVEETGAGGFKVKFWYKGDEPNTYYYFVADVEGSIYYLDPENQKTMLGHWK